MEVIGVEVKENQHDLAAVWELLHKIDKKLDLHLQNDAANAPKLAELVVLLDRSKGILIFLTWASVIVGTLGAMALWIKDHIK